MSFGIQSSFGYDAQLYSKITRHALKGEERGVTSGNWALQQVCGSELAAFYERQLILITALPNKFRTFLQNTQAATEAHVHNEHL